jgi:hypothetical protein
MMQNSPSRTCQRDAELGSGSMEPDGYTANGAPASATGNLSPYLEYKMTSDASSSRKKRFFSRISDLLA